MKDTVHSLRVRRWGDSANAKAAIKSAISTTVRRALERESGREKDTTKDSTHSLCTNAWGKHSTALSVIRAIIRIRVRKGLTDEYCQENFLCSYSSLQERFERKHGKEQGRKEFNELMKNKVTVGTPEAQETIEYLFSQVTFPEAPTHISREKPKRGPSEAEKWVLANATVRCGITGMEIKFHHAGLEHIHEVCNGGKTNKDNMIFIPRYLNNLLQTVKYNPEEFETIKASTEAFFSPLAQERLSALLNKSKEQRKEAA